LCPTQEVLLILGTADIWHNAIAGMDEQGREQATRPKLELRYFKRQVAGDPTLLEG
jgi:hypothetical protein